MTTGSTKTPCKTAIYISVAFSLTGLAPYATITVMSEPILDPVARQAVTILSWTLGCLGQIFSLMGSCMEPRAPAAGQREGTQAEIILQEIE
jgi:hypothetical protein